uniref:RING-type domain-containing protein n=1 Tax=Rhabditophanes sp. KR3021 TaxID=114890 RepID=A0AC35TMN8_9BILA
MATNYTELGLLFHCFQKKSFNKHLAVAPYEKVKEFLPLLVATIEDDGEKNVLNEICTDVPANHELLLFEGCKEVASTLQKLVNSGKMKKKMSELIKIDPLKELFDNVTLKVIQMTNNVFRLIHDSEYTDFQQDCHVMYAEIGQTMTLLAELGRQGILNPGEICLKLSQRLSNETFATSFAMNMPQDFDRIIVKLLRSFKGHSGSMGDINIENVIRNLFILDPSKINLFKEMNINEIDIDLFINIICQADHDLFMDNISYYLTNVSEDVIKFMKAISRSYVDQISHKFDTILHDYIVKNECSVEILKVMVNLSNYLGVRFKGVNSKTWIAYLTRTDGVPDSYLTLHLAIIIGFAIIFIPSNYDGEHNQEAISSFFDYLKVKTADNETIKGDSLSQYMLLMAILFDMDENRTLKELLEKILDINVALKLKRMVTARQMYLEHALSIEDVLSRVGWLEVTPSLSADTQGFLPIHCVNYLLKLRKLSTKSMNVTTWVQKQIKETSTPCPDSIIQLIISFAESNVQQKVNDHCLPPLAIEFIEQIFTGSLVDEDKLLTRCLCLLYLLSYKAQVLEHLTKIPGSKAKCVYSDELLERIPVTYLITMADIRRSELGLIYGKCVGILNTFYPYSMAKFTYDDTDLTNADDEASLVIGEYDEEVSLTEEEILGLKHSKFLKIAMYSNRVITSITKLLDSPNQYSVGTSNHLLKYWRCLFNLFPERLAHKTIQQWCKSDAFVDRDIVENPLRIFRCHELIFSSPNHFAILMELLDYYLLKYKVFVSGNLSRRNLITPEEGKVFGIEMDEISKIRDVTMNSLKVTIIQILLDCCLENENNKKTLTQIQEMVCRYIHNNLIDNEHLVVVLHYQTYHKTLIEMVVKNIPSVHVMRAHYEEMFVVPELNKKVFGILLFIELALKYRVPTAYVHVEFILDFIVTMKTHISTADFINTMLTVLPAIPKLLDAFPQISIRNHIEEVFMIAKEVGKSNVATYTSLLSMMNAPGYKLLTLINELQLEFNLNGNEGA